MSNQYTTDKRKIQTTLNKAHNLAKSKCANYTGKTGCIQTAHGECVLSFECERVTANVCPYFMKSVLPADPIFFQEYLSFFPDDYPLKPKKEKQINTHKCTECNKAFIRKSNRQIYCQTCANERRKRQSRLRMREHRNKANK